MQDINSGYNLRNSEVILDRFDNIKEYNVNEILEFYNIILFF